MLGIIKWFGPLILTAIIQANQLNAEDLTSVLRTPSRYHQKRVTLTGVLFGSGPVLELFATAADAREADVRKSVWVVTPDGWQPRPIHMRRARIVGIIDANGHGMRGNPCEMKLEKLTILSGPVVPWEDSYIICHNETKTTVLFSVTVPLKRSTHGSKGLVSPGAYFESAALGLRYSAEINVLTATGTPITKGTFSVGPGTPFFDTENAASYFRVKDGKIERISPLVAKSWGWKR
jgi:hypothetical protein